MKYFIIILTLALSLKTQAQFLDSIKVFIKSRPSIDARLETRNSFIENDRAKVTGVRLGVTFRKKLKFGAGYSWLNSDINNPLFLKDENGVVYKKIDNYLKFGYGCLYTDFVFHKTKRWQLSVPLQLGIGAYWFRYQDDLETINSKKRLLLLYEPGISVQFKIFTWLGLGSDIAYRFTARNTRYIGEKLNSPTYAFKLLIWFDQLYYIGFPKSKLTKKYGPESW